MAAKGYTFEPEANRLQAHTKILEQAVEDLNLNEGFVTIAEGKDLSHGNCFAYPANKGAWRVIRHGRGTKEHESWETTKEGWTATWLNRAQKKEGGDRPT